VGIAYLNGSRLRRSLIAAADWVDAGRDELNRINVFPVPDGDTGTNFSMTLRAVAEAVRDLRDPAFPTVVNTMAEASVLGAHGNSGMLLSHFLLGFRDAVAHHTVATPTEIARGLRTGADRLYAALEEPVEGTITTVSREVADAAEKAAEVTHNLEDLMRRLVARGRAALARTPELLSTLKDAGVVDAGGMGFVLLLEGIMRLIEGQPVTVPAGSGGAGGTMPRVAAATANVVADRDYQYCTEVLVRGATLPPTTEIRTALRKLGGSIVILATRDLLKLHIHTDAPHDVFAVAAQWGTLERKAAEDMRAQHQRLREETEGSIGVVVDSTCDLPDEVVDRCGIVIVPIQIADGERTYLDRVELRGDALYDRMRTDTTIFTTSQPSPGAFIDAYRDARGHASEVLCLALAAKLSGTFTAAQTAVATSGISGITVFDSVTVSLGLGMLALRARELADDGWPVEAITRELTRIRKQSGGVFTVDRFDNLLRSGRVGRARAWLGNLLDVKPILELGQDGQVHPVDRVHGAPALVPRVLDYLDRRFAERPSRLRIGIVHADAADVADRLETEIRRRFTPRECLVSSVTAALGVHVGPGAWGVFYQIEDGTPKRDSGDGSQPASS
jgi:DegV family protein with EDD domain